MPEFLIAIIIVLLLGVGRRVFGGSKDLFQWFPVQERGVGSRHLWWFYTEVENDTPWVTKAFIFRNEVPWFDGTGIRFRVHRRAFTVGYGTEVAAAGWYRDMDVPVSEIDQGVDGVWEEEAKPLGTDRDHGQDTEADTDTVDVRSGDAHGEHPQPDLA